MSHIIDLQTIRNNYEALTDAQLERIAREDGHMLTNEAYEILKDQISRRQLDPAHIDHIEATRRQLDEQDIAAIRAKDKEGYDRALWEYVFTQKIAKTPEPGILQGLEERGVSEGKSLEMLENVQPKLEELIAKHSSKKSIGGLIFAAGIMITGYTYLNASIHGGSYFVLWGAVIFGGFYFFNEGKHTRHYRELLNELHKHTP